MSNNKKIISVFGATGAQGGSVARALLKAGYEVRAFTRNVDSEASKKLKEVGATLVKADISQPEQDLQKAIEGSYGVFLVTSFDGTPVNTEFEQGSKVANASLKANVKHLVFSGLSPCQAISNGKLYVAHFDEKFKVEEYLRKLSLDNAAFVTSFVYPPFYFQNFLSYYKPSKNEDGSYTISLPQDPKVPLDMSDITDIGAIVAAEFQHPEKYSGKVVPFSGSFLTGEEIVKVTGKTVKYNFIPTEVYAKLFPGAQELADMFEFFTHYGTFPTQDKTIAPTITKLSTLEDYLISTNFKLE
ncbi:NmrA-like protein [Tieghemostelium lacteum]|uniref:NmrA-like protein n=1 Tax=Tieghemostelium lacteum TaxID=361077 RepID=A0A151Z562_TIELA|nr:NmrA-like protein [Tieghemostelium lacteum]|eukprot:KYQ89100.1 NmrA-like protein [Tieghemostelium lacteum]